MLVKLDHFPKVRGENKKWLKPPVRSVLSRAPIISTEKGGGEISPVTDLYGHYFRGSMYNVRAEGSLRSIPWSKTIWPAGFPKKWLLRNGRPPRKSFINKLKPTFLPIGLNERSNTDHTPGQSKNKNTVIYVITIDSYTFTSTTNLFRTVISVVDSSLLKGQTWKRPGQLLWEATPSLPSESIPVNETWKVVLICPPLLQSFLVGGFELSWKIFVKFDHIPNFRGENPKCLKPPLSFLLNILKCKLLSSLDKKTANQTHIIIFPSVCWGCRAFALGLRIWWRDILLDQPRFPMDFPETFWGVPFRKATFWGPRSCFRSL